MEVFFPDKERWGWLHFLHTERWLTCFQEPRRAHKLSVPMDKHSRERTAIQFAHIIREETRILCALNFGIILPDKPLCL